MIYVETRDTRRSPRTTRDGDHAITDRRIAGRANQHAHTPTHTPPNTPAPLPNHAATPPNQHDNTNQPEDRAPPHPGLTSASYGGQSAHKTSAPPSSALPLGRGEPLADRATLFSALLGPGCSRLRVGDRIGALTVWGADAQRVCVPEANAVEAPEDLDPAQVVSLVFTYMTAYQLLHRTARAKRGETVLVHGAAGRVGTAVLELAALAGLRIYGTCSARDRAAVERLGAAAIDYRNEDFLARVRELPGKGVDVALDGIGGRISLRSFRALRPGGRLVVYGHHATLAHGHKSRRAWIEWYAATAAVALWGMLSPSRRVSAYRIQQLREGHQALPVSAGRQALPVGGGPRHPEWFREDFRALLELLRADKIHPIVAERLPLTDARRAHEMLETPAAKGKLVLVP